MNEHSIESSPRDAEYSAPPATSRDPDTPRALMLDVLRSAAAAYHEATRRKADAWRRCKTADGSSLPYDEGREWERWASIYTEAECNAQLLLVRAILMATGRIQSHWDIEELGDAWRPCAFELDKVLYVVSQDPNGDVGQARPVLVVLDTTRDVDSDCYDS